MSDHLSEAERYRIALRWEVELRETCQAALAAAEARAEKAEAQRDRLASALRLALVELDPDSGSLGPYLPTDLWRDSVVRQARATLASGRTRPDFATQGDET